MFAFLCRRARDRRLRDAGVVVGTLAYQRAMNKGILWGGCYTDD